MQWNPSWKTVLLRTVQWDAADVKVKVSLGSAEVPELSKVLSFKPEEVSQNTALHASPAAY